MKKAQKISNIFKTKSGKIVIGQFPNRPLIVAIVFYLLKFDLGVSIAMIYWSYLEIFYGVNIWRKFLGIMVGIYFLSTLPIFS